jgi:RNA polymerase sigma-70 factor (ECF subfamily)
MQRMNGHDVQQAEEQHLRFLLLGGLAGDAGAYQVFLQALSVRLRKFLRRRLIGFPDEVEDLVQESLLVVHEQRHAYDPGQPLSAWVQAIARHKLVDLLRRRALREALSEPLDEASECFATADSPAAEAQCDVIRLLKILPARQRLPIVHVKLEGRSVKETARLIGMSESAIKVSIYRGLKFLAEKIRNGG